MNRWVGWAGIGLMAGGCTIGQSRRAESVPAEPLPIAADTVVVPWTNVPEAAWLGGRRWVVVGADHDAAVFVDFTAKSATPVGGSPNPELAKPYGAFAVADTAFIADWAKHRLTLWPASGKLAGAVEAPGQTRGILPKARDAAGQYYFEIPPVAGTDGSGLKDSSVIVRSDATFARFDTLARLSPPDIAEITEARGRRYERLVFSGLDGWGVRPDGRLWIARVRRNEVSIYAGKKEHRGERLPDPVLEVTRVDREQYIATFPEDLRPMAEKLQFASLKPPFERAFSDPAGLVWLRKSKPALDSVRRYHVVDTAGMLTRVFTTLGSGVIVAAGDRTVLLAEQFKGGIRLMELPLPAKPPAPKQ